jgi:hypothetical protein
MLMMNLKQCCFFIWTPAESQMHFITFDESFVKNTMIPQAQQVYWETFIPMLRSEAQTRIKANEEEDRVSQVEKDQAQAQVQEDINGSE